MKDNDSSLVDNLRASITRVGQIYPVIEDSNGNLIDGQHRLEADPNWPRMRLKSVRTEKDTLITKLVCNSCRRTVSAREKSKIVGNLAKILANEGVKPGEISKRIAEETGMSYPWVMKYLPDEYKNTSQSKRAKSAIRCTAEIHDLFKLGNPVRQNLVKISRYSNMDHVICTITRHLIERIENIAAALDTNPGTLIQNIIEEKLREIESLGYRWLETRQQTRMDTHPFPRYITNSPMSRRH